MPKQSSLVLIFLLLSETKVSLLVSFFRHVHSITSAVAKTQCITCGKGKVTYDCKGCQQPFCLNHLIDHNRQLSEQLEDLENQRNLFKQTLSQHLPSERPGIQQIDQWEEDSIRQIQQRAQEARDLLEEYTSECIPQIEIEIDKLTDEMKELRHENDFDERHLNQLKTKLEKLREQLEQQKKIEIKEDSILIEKISVGIPLRKFIETLS